jgi:hypothetical protein
VTGGNSPAGTDERLLTPMKFLVLLYQDPSTFPTDNAGIEKQIAAYDTYTQSVLASNSLIAGNPLVPMPDAVRTIAAGSTKTGPPVARTEALIGFYVLEFPTLDAAVASAHALPTASAGSIEVVPFRDM